MFNDVPSSVPRPHEVFNKVLAEQLQLGMFFEGVQFYACWLQ
jgi:hypothetical protein